MHRNTIMYGWMLLLAFLPVACSSPVSHQEENTPSIWGQLTDEESRLARDLAEEELFKPDNQFSPGEKIYYTRIQLLPDSQAETANRVVVVTHYRYQGNQAILTHVDLNTRKVREVVREVNLPTPLAREEFDLAVKLARQEPQVVKLFEQFGADLHVEGKIGWPATIADPTVPHRNVYLLFRVGGDYLTGPSVIVDLVNETVQVQEVKS
jgi:hypothetical protein